MSSTRNKAPWAYLLRLPMGSGALALRNPEEVVHHKGKQYFSIRRRMIWNFEINNISAECLINGKHINKVSLIEHGWKITVPSKGREYIFVDCDFSNKELQPIGLNETHALGQLLGEGGFGKVYVCFEKKSTSPLALKIAREGSDREKEILKSLNHEHLIHTIFFKNVGKRTFIGMEYMAGGDLSAFVQYKTVCLSEKQTKLIFYQIAEGVSYLHDIGICHRDLKPANVLMHRARPNTLVKVTDLGISKSELFHSPMDTACGTRNFMAPEIYSRNYTKKVDVWSLGVILYLSLTGSYATVANKEVSLPTMTSNQNVTKLIKKMLQYSPTNRASISEVLENEWLQDEHMKKEVEILEREYQNASNDQQWTQFEKLDQTEINDSGVVYQSKKMKQTENEGIGFTEAICLVVGGIVMLALAILVR